jgi:hypothetical protein
MASTPQNVFQNAQNFDPDIKEMYKHFVTGGATADDFEAGENIAIDDLRASVSINVTGQTTANLLKSLNLDPNSTTPPSTANTSTPGQSLQESRCHTFYRIIGFPVINSDKSEFYNPGFDMIMTAGVTRKVTFSTKLDIAKNIDPKFESLSQARESYANNTARIFSVPESVGAGVLSLMSGTYGTNGTVNIRKFALPFTKSTDAFDFNVANQTNPISAFSTYSLVGDNEVLLADYQDSSGNNIITAGAIATTNPSVFQQHFHIIKPFMVDPRIDFSIWAHTSQTSNATSKRIAVPFVLDASQLQTSSTATAERPLLEKIITDRFSQFDNTADAGPGMTDVVNYVQSVPAIQSVQIGTATISQIFSGKIFQLDQQSAFAKYLSIIQAMMDKLVKSMKIIHAAQGKYYWLPQPDVSGPEGNCTIRPVPLNANIPSTLITVNDFNIAFNLSQVLLSNITSSVSQANTLPDVGGFAFNAFFNNKNTFDSSTSNAQGDLSSRTRTLMNAKRDSELIAAGNALQIVEMIMGEYSGLGLCDIIAVVGSLHVVDKNTLLGFLDDDAYTRAGLILGQSLPSKPAISDAMTTFANTVNGFYQIMDAIFLDYLNNNALNQQNT